MTVTATIAGAISCGQFLLPVPGQRQQWRQCHRLDPDVDPGPDRRDDHPDGGLAHARIFRRQARRRDLRQPALACFSAGENLDGRLPACRRKRGASPGHSPYVHRQPAFPGSAWTTFSRPIRRRRTGSRRRLSSRHGPPGIGIGGRPPLRQALGKPAQGTRTRALGLTTVFHPVDGCHKRRHQRGWLRTFRPITTGPGLAARRVRRSHAAWRLREGSQLDEEIAGSGTPALPPADRAPGTRHRHHIAAAAWLDPGDPRIAPRQRLAT